MKPAQCPNCGASIAVDESKDAGICEFCNTAFVTEKAVSIIGNTSNNAQIIINNYYNTPVVKGKAKKTTKNEPSSSKKRGPTISQALQCIIKPWKIKEVYWECLKNGSRPEIKFWAALLGFCMLLWPGVMYILVTKQKQRDWDRIHGAKEV